jgi:hypothetical protein
MIVLIVHDLKYASMVTFALTVVKVSPVIAPFAALASITFEHGILHYTAVLQNRLNIPFVHNHSYGSPTTPVRR